MLEIVEALFAVVGMLTSVAVLALWLVWDELPDSASQANDPYDDALATSARISAMAYEAHQAMHQAALAAHLEED
jgi:hypothetical protein